MAEPTAPRLLELADIPNLCFDPRFEKQSESCRLCEVEVKLADGRTRRVRACATRLEPGMELQPESAELAAHRKAVLEMLAQTIPADRPWPDARAPLARYFERYGVERQARSTASPAPTPHPYLRLDLDFCVHCRRCERICTEVQGQDVWRNIGRGAESRFVPGVREDLAASGCVSCGACEDACPSGAITDDASRSAAKLDPASIRWTRTTCPYCGTGCEMDVAVADDRIVEIRPALDSPVNRGHLCVKGRYGADYVDSKKRVTDPKIRRGGRWVTVSWDEALDQAAREILDALGKKGPDAIGVLASARGTNEEGYLAQKLARAVIGTNNVDCCARVCHAPSAKGLALTLGTGAATNAFDDIERAEGFLIVGCNPTENHPIVGVRIRARVRGVSLGSTRGRVPLVVIDPRKTELAALADVHLPIRPGTNVPVLLAMARLIVKNGWLDADYVARRTEGLNPDFLSSLEPWTPEAAAAVCRIDPELIVRAAEIYASAKPAMAFHGLGVTENLQGTEGVMAIAQLALLTGNLGKPGSGVNPLRGQNNVQGTAVMGCEPNRLTGSQPFEKAGTKHAETWKRPISPTRGLTQLAMLDAARAGNLRAMVMIGYDVLLSNPNLAVTREALAKLDSLVIVDLFETLTAREFGTVFLPAASAFEKDGTFMNSERRIQRVRKCVEPRGQARPDSWILSELARRVTGEGQGFESAGDPSAVWDEVRSLWPAVSGISYRRIEKHGLQWPCPDKSHPGTGHLHEKAFPIGERATLKAIPFHPSREIESPDFPLILNTGRTLAHFNAATMTGASRNIEMIADDFVEIHPREARQHGVAHLNRVKVVTHHGSFVGTAHVTDKVNPGELFAVFHRPDAYVNLATGTGRDPYCDTPEYKVTAARIERM